MSDLAGALADTSKLTPMDGRPVIRTTISVTRAGDGLSEALKIDPQEFRLGERVFVVLECEVDKLRFEPIKDTEAVTRVHVLRAGTATIVDAELVEHAIREQADRIRRAREEAEGILRLPGVDDGDDTEMVEAHETGGHATGLVDGCPLCDDEATAERLEAGED